MCEDTSSLYMCVEIVVYTCVWTCTSSLYMCVDIIIITVVCTDLMSIGRKLVLCSSDTTQHVLSVLKEGEEGRGRERRGR